MQRSTDPLKFATLVVFNMLSSTFTGIFFSVSSFVTLASASRSLSLTAAGPASVDTVEKLKISTTLTNTGDETLKILNDPRGPLNELPTDTFAITDANGAQPSFTGIKVKYVPKTAAEAGGYTTLAPGQSISVEHNLAHTYNFTRSGATRYDFHPHNAFLVVNYNSTISTIYADSSAHAAHVSGRLVAVRPMPILGELAGYNNCSSSQQRALVSAASTAQSYAAAASSYAATHTAASPRYTTWFGTYTTARHSTVASHFKDISSNTFSSFTFDCTCTDSSTYSYVYPDTFGYIYLCGAFWKAPTTGTDSKGGTIIHESSHFTVNGGTVDNAYGQTSCKSLAISSPELAVQNADSHEYFAENNPALS